MRAHIIKDGKVANTIIVDSLDDLPGLINADSGNIGDSWDGETFTPPEKPVPTVTEKFTELKTDFLTYLVGRYDLGTQGTIQMAFTNPDSSEELKAKAKDVGDWILTVQAYYKARKLEILAGDVTVTWDFATFDSTKPVWDFDDFV